MKAVLSEIVKTLEEIATSVAALETALVARKYLQTGETDQYQNQQQVMQHQNLAKLRRMVAALDS